jgi:hypothetical protein
MNKEFTNPNRVHGPRPEQAHKPRRFDDATFDRYDDSTNSREQKARRPNRGQDLSPQLDRHV